MKTWTTIVIFASALFVGACAGPTVVDNTTDKGAEEPLPENNKDDSFKKPTEHGALTFGLVAQAEFTADTRYHVWDFTLTDEASIRLQTNISTKNLDTVMYLYRREAGATSWGHYKRRNDDWDGNIWSKIEHEGDAAEYRVLVKAFKKQFTGHFTLESDCAGAGCPTATGSDDIHSFPTATGDLTRGCWDHLDAVLHSPVMGGDGHSILYPEERALLPEVTQKAADYYMQYWDDIGIWEDMDFGDGHGLNIGSTLFEDGHLIEIDLGGDEDTLYFAFDGQGDLLAYYHSEQSPTYEILCDNEGDETPTLDDIPEEFCFGAWMRYAPHDQDTEADLGGHTTVSKAREDEDEDVPAMVAKAIAHYAEKLGLDADAELSFHGMQWEADGGFATGASFTIQADDKPGLTYETGDSEFDTTWVFTASTDAKLQFVCLD